MRGLHVRHWMLAYQLSRMEGRAVCLIRGWRTFAERSERTFAAPHESLTFRVSVGQDKQLEVFK